MVRHLESVPQQIGPVPTAIESLQAVRILIRQYLGQALIVSICRCDFPMFDSIIHWAVGSAREPDI
jgi:hypothetical protein